MNDLLTRDVKLNLFSPPFLHLKLSNVALGVGGWVFGKSTYTQNIVMRLGIEREINTDLLLLSHQGNGESVMSCRSMHGLTYLNEAKADPLSGGALHDIARAEDRPQRPDSFST